MKAWLYDCTTASIRSVRKQLNILQQRAYASGFATIRPVASQPVHQPMDSQKQAPSSAPLKELQDLLDWTPDAKPFQDLLKATVQLSQAQRKKSQAERPRLLVCHDLHGNYHADALPQGSADADYYRLTQWSSIDVFVYFSHALVTIPPPGWINAAHTNGVPILGTFITEWEAGSILCELLLWTEQSAEAAALQLANIAVFYGFDGWLLNVENPILHRHVPNLVHFIRVLRRVMHEMVPASQVIWYDAVTTEGILQWQDTLNHLNMPFFEAADAIFINYTWKEGTPSQAGAVAGARKHDVYMGVDVFGRNTYGGGGMSCNVALTAARSAGLSAALFAPAWVWEVGNRTDWLQRQQDFWGSIQACWELPRALVCQLPFSTCFDQGAGHARFSEGELVWQQPWYNLSCQSPQPFIRLGSISYNPFNNAFLRANTSAGQASLSASLCTDLAFQLGSCLQLQGAVAPGTSGSVEIFTADLLIPGPGLRVAFTYKPSLPASQLQLELWCWMEPSNSGDAGTTTGTGSLADDGSAVKGTESGARAGDAGARGSGSGAKQSESGARSSESRAASGESGTIANKSGGRTSESGATGSGSGVRMLAMLQANGAVIVTDEPVPGCLDEQAATASAQLAVESRVQHSSGWLTLYYRLPSRLPDFSCLTLRSIEVAAVAPVDPPTTPLAELPEPLVEPCLGFVGLIAITEWDQPIEEPKVPGISFQDVIWTAPTSSDTTAAEPPALQSSSAAIVTATAGSPTCELGAVPGHQDSLAPADAPVSSNSNSTVPSAIWLYATLSFSPANPRAASRFEVFYKIHAGSSAGSSSIPMAASTTGWGWLGSTESSQFRVAQLEVPVNATSVEFAVQGADVLGKLTPFENAAFATMQRP